jgi:fatty-acyl-CoA synthase
MIGVTEPSYSHGASEVPLLGETIGANLRRVAATHPDREAVGGPTPGSTPTPTPSPAA